MQNNRDIRVYRKKFDIIFEEVSTGLVLVFDDTNSGYDHVYPGAECVELFCLWKEMERYDKTGILNGVRAFFAIWKKKFEYRNVAYSMLKVPYAGINDIPGFLKISGNSHEIYKFDNSGPWGGDIREDDYYKDYIKDLKSLPFMVNELPTDDDVAKRDEELKKHALDIRDARDIQKAKEMTYTFIGLIPSALLALPFAFHEYGLYYIVMMSVAACFWVTAKKGYNLISGIFGGKK